VDSFVDFDENVDSFLSNVDGDGSDKFLQHLNRDL